MEQSLSPANRNPNKEILVWGWLVCSFLYSACMCFRLTFPNTAINNHSLFFVQFKLEMQTPISVYLVETRQFQLKKKVMANRSWGLLVLYCRHDYSSQFTHDQLFRGGVQSTLKTWVDSRHSPHTHTPPTHTRTHCPGRKAMNPQKHSGDILTSRGSLHLPTQCHCRSLLPILPE